MNFFQELRQRRVFQITSGYIVGGWGLLQFLAFLESRMAVSPNLVNLIGLALLFLLPAVVIMAWVHGRPGRDTWGRTPKVVVTANLVAAVLLIGFMFRGADLGGVTETVEVADENGMVTERVVPKSEYVRRVLVFPPDGSAEDDWARETTNYLVSIDLFQDAFLDVVAPNVIPSAFARAGYPRGKNVPRPLQRKLARDALLPYFVTGKVARTAEGWRLDTELHESESGKLAAKRSFTGADLFSVADEASRQLRVDLEIPAAHLENSVDLPVAELTSSDIDAVRSYAQATMLVRVDNDWAGALPLLQAATERDPQFALAQFLRFAVLQSLGDIPAATEAIELAMANLYRAPERMQFVIKANYYYSEKQDADKGLAVLKMWSRLHPHDIAALDQLATYSIIQQDTDAAIAAYEQILSIDPSRVSFIDNLASLYTQKGDIEAAERCLQRHVDAYPTSPRGYEDLSDFYSSVGRLDEAREALDHALLLEPDKESLVISSISLDIKVGRFREAEAALQEMLAAATSEREELLPVSRLLMLESALGRNDRLEHLCEEIYRCFLALQNPLQANLTYSMLLPALSISGRPESAMERLTVVRAEIPAPYDELVGVAEAWVMAEQGRLDEARAKLASAEVVVEQFKFETFRSSMMLVEGMIVQAAGDADAAAKLFREAMNSAPMATMEYHRLLVRGLRLAGRFDEAQAALDDALSVEPAHPVLQLEKAHLALARGETDLARQALDLALATWSEASPEFPPANEARELMGSLDDS